MVSPRHGVHACTQPSVHCDICPLVMPVLTAEVQASLDREHKAVKEKDGSLDRLQVWMPWLLVGLCVWSDHTSPSHC